MRRLLSGCLMAIGAVVVVIAVGAILFSHGTASRAPGLSASSASTTDQTEVPTFSVTRANTTYFGATASDVGVAILPVGDAGPYLSDGYEMARADGKFIVVGVAISNRQNTAITMSTGLFEILDSNGNTYSASDKSLTLVGENNDLFLAQINPGITKTGLVVFDVPQELRLDGMKLKFTGGMTGDSAFLPLKVNSTAGISQPAPTSAPQPTFVPSIERASEGQPGVQNAQEQQPVTLAAPELPKANQLSIGQTPEEVEAILGPPISITTGARHVFQHSNFAVVFKDGKVSEIERNGQKP